MCAGNAKALDEYLKMYGIMAERCHGVRRPGSAALDLAYVAAGRSDGFYEKGLKPWDIAAGSLMVTEAGGIVGEFSGESDYLYKGDIIAASPKIFGQMVGLLTPYRIKNPHFVTKKGSVCSLYYFHNETNAY
jgi:myo-inositol-1(or 4)-monophosphatase